MSLEMEQSRKELAGKYEFFLGFSYSIPVNLRYENWWEHK